MQRRTFCTCSFSALIASGRASADKGESAETPFCSSMYPAASEGLSLGSADLTEYSATDFSHLVNTAQSMLPSGIEMQISFSDRLESAAFQSWSDTIVIGLKNATGEDSLRMAILILLHEISHSLQVTRARSRETLLNYRGKGANETKIIESHADILSGYLLFILLKRAYPDDSTNSNVSDGHVQNGFIYDSIAEDELCSGNPCSSDNLGSGPINPLERRLAA